MVKRQDLQQIASILDLSVLGVKLSLLVKVNKASFRARATTNAPRP